MSDGIFTPCERCAARLSVPARRANLCEKCSDALDEWVAVGLDVAVVYRVCEACDDEPMRLRGSSSLDGVTEFDFRCRRCGREAWVRLTTGERDGGCDDCGTREDDAWSPGECRECFRYPGHRSVDHWRPKDE
jgi:DNA-directed RNA polymerase subunit RPC12/RpoP